MIKVITNSNGSGDWAQIMEGDYTMFEGHRVGIQDLVFLLQRYTKVELVEVTDEEMEEGEF
jgi:hypothetical protein